MHVIDIYNKDVPACTWTNRLKKVSFSPVLWVFCNGRNRIFVYNKYIQEWLGCMVAAGIVTITDDEKYSPPHDKTQLKIWGHNATAIPVLSELIPKLDEATALDGPKGGQNTYEQL